MLSVSAALEQVLKHAAPKGSARVPLSAAAGRVLAEDVRSDIDSPPYDKSLRDGYAVIAADFEAGRREFDVLEEVVAGQLPTQTVVPGTATRIMTGAPLPEGADAVVMFEETQALSDGERVSIRSGSVRPGQWIMRQGQAMRSGETVLTAGTAIRPVEVGLLAEVGRTMLQVASRPQVAILPTGDEVIPPDQQPGPGQIRNSNGPLLAAAVARHGGEPVDLGIGPDDVERLHALVAAGLENDVLLLCGGVSAGTRDLVPGVLSEQGVREVFHHVNLKPGKPLWFGVAAGKDRPTLVFGLPGNPVSGLVCFELFVRPALDRMAGKTEVGLQFQRAELTAPFQQRGERMAFLPALLRQDESGLKVEIVGWQGSPDLRGVARANALIQVPGGDRSYQPGETVRVLPL